MAEKTRTRKPVLPVVHHGDTVRLEEATGKLVEGRIVIIDAGNGGSSGLAVDSTAPDAIKNLVDTLHQSMLAYFEQYKGAINKVLRLQPQANDLHYIVALSDSGNLDVETELYGLADELAFNNGDLVAIQLQFVRPNLIDRFQHAETILG